MSFCSYYFGIYLWETDRVNIDCVWNNSLQSTKSGLFKYVSPAVADSWASLNPPPNNLISFLLFLHCPCVRTTSTLPRL